MYTNYQKIVWDAVPGATQYQVRILQNNIILRQESIVATSSIDLTFTPVPNSLYRVIVYPLSPVNVCRVNPTTHNYIFSSASGGPTAIGSSTLAASELRISPNPIVAGGRIDAALLDMQAGEYNIAVTSINGQVLSLEKVEHPGGDKHVSISTENLPSGLYFISCQGKNFQKTAKVVIQ